MFRKEEHTQHPSIISPAKASLIALASGAGYVGWRAFQKQDDAKLQNPPDTAEDEVPAQTHTRDVLSPAKKRLSTFSAKRRFSTFSTKGRLSTFSTKRIKARRTRPFSARRRLSTPQVQKPFHADKHVVHVGDSSPDVNNSISIDIVNIMKNATNSETGGPPDICPYPSRYAIARQDNSVLKSRDLYGLLKAYATQGVEDTTKMTCNQEVPVLCLSECNNYVHMFACIAATLPVKQLDEHLKSYKICENIPDVLTVKMNMEGLVRDRTVLWSYDCLDREVRYGNITCRNNIWFPDMKECIRVFESMKFKKVFLFKKPDKQFLEITYYWTSKPQKVYADEDKNIYLQEYEFQWSNVEILVNSNKETHLPDEYEWCSDYVPFEFDDEIEKAYTEQTLKHERLRGEV